MAQARQQYVADWAYVDKQRKEFTLTNEIIEKLDSIEPSAERNAIQWIKVNGQIQTPDQYRVVDLTIPEVVDNLDSYDNESSLSARQGRVLAQQIKNLQSIWKFLSNWNSTTGLPTSNPSTIPYVYKPWDYYIVSIVGSANYRPEWTSFDWSSSSTLETELVDVWDIYIYDDEWWLLLHNSARVIAVDTSLSTSSTNPVENRVITQALNTKQEKIIAGANIQIAQDWKTISATDTTYDNLPAAQGWTADSLVTTGDKYNWDNKQKALTAWANIQIAQDGTISATDTVYWAWANIQINWNIISATDTTYVAWDFDIKDLADSTGLRTEWSWKQDELIAWTNIQIAADWKTISATDTTYTAGTWIDITNWVISNTQTSAEWWNITWTLSSQTDLQNALDWKLDKVTSTATNPRAYVVNADWSQATLPITDSATSGAIVRRNWTQITVPATPSANTDAASKKYVDDQVSAATAGAVSDTAYSSAWDWVTWIAPSKNAVYDKISAMDTTISWHTSSISTINWKIPAEASTSNQLADKAFVGDSINSVTAYYITKNANWDQWSNRAELFAATTFYSGGVVRVPTKNDYTIVLADENHDNATTRYIYNSGWEYQYTVNETALTQAQLDALNSWITSWKVSTYDWYATTISWKQDALTLPTTPTQWHLVTWGANNKTLADWWAIPTVPTKVSDLQNDSGFITGITSWDVTTALWYTPANDSSVVKLTGNQTVAWTKTFSTSPVVPSKTTDATNTGTAIATEAQVYKKQDTLVSWTNIKTVNWNSILGSGDLTISWWIQLDANSPITVSKLWVGTEAQYSALGSYSNDTVYMTV